jgi:hypothetical protein
MNITHIEKDKVLNCLCTSGVVPESSYGLNRLPFLQACGLDTDAVNSILTYFSRIGLVSDVNYRHQASVFYLIVHTEAFDLYNRGGFHAQEVLFFKTNEILEKLRELESQFSEEEKRDFPKKLSLIASIITIAGAMAKVVGKFVEP